MANFSLASVSLVEMVWHLLLLSDMPVQTVDLTRLPNLTGFLTWVCGSTYWLHWGLSGAWLWRGRVGMLQEESQLDYNVLHPQKKQ